MSDFVTLVDEEGKEHEFEVENILDVDGNKYAVLIPMDEEYADSNEAVIMRFGMDEDGEEVLFDIESDEEWDKVANVYDEIVDEFDNDDYDDDDYDEDDDDDDDDDED
ncbi:MAG: DUF1292 domain-containing protein [Clostridiales bacterium]|nr:DUF1292 domain-containing protein [Clostridiales bacterium]